MTKAPTNARVIAAGLLIILASASPSAAVWAATGPASCAAAGSAAYPSFCDIPKTPTDIRPATAFKAAVVDTRVAGRRVVRATGSDTFGLPLGEADAFSRAAQAEAAPPPEASTAPPEDSAAAAAELRRRATPPPPRPH
jgi:hypothetical protein